VIISGLGKDGVLNGIMGEEAEELDVSVREDESKELGAFCLSR